jgi:hypothetical protein
MINDIPKSTLDSLLVGVILEEQKESVDHKFKPNGITDNRKKWERKNAIRKVVSFVDYHQQKTGKVS